MDPVRSKAKSVLMQENKTSSSGRGTRNVEGSEMRPGGMLVQKRDSESNQNSANSIPMIKVRVKYGPSRCEIRISSQASFGELKKMLAEQTGVHHQDQKLIYKKKERDSRAYLDVSGVKDGSKIVLIEDTTSRERRRLEMIKSANIEKAKKSMQQISSEVDNLQGKVAALEATASGGGKVAEIDVDTMIEIFMNKLIALDGIFVDGDLKAEKKMEERRVQKHIETLDMVKLKSSKSSHNDGSKLQSAQQENLMDKIPIPNGKHTVQSKQVNITPQFPLQQQSLGRSESVVITTKWETFD